MEWFKFHVVVGYSFFSAGCSSNKRSERFLLELQSLKQDQGGVAQRC